MGALAFVPLLFPDSIVVGGAGPDGRLATGDRARWYLLGGSGGTRGIPPSEASTGISDLDSDNSRLAIVVAVVITVANTDMATMPGNVFLPAAATGLPKDSVVNVTAVVTLNKTDSSEPAGQPPLALLREIDRGLRHVLDL
jgi:mRNA interferase MazF